MSDRAADLYVFGYGSLVDPASLGRTLGRPVVLGVDAFSATLAGYGRRWNYAVSRAVGLDAGGQHWTLIALGLVAAVSEEANGVVARVSRDELALLDARESRYDRLDVTEHVEPVSDALGDAVAAATVFTYLPRREAVADMEAAAAAGRAAIERRYWDLVGDAFDAIGEGDRYRATTPPTDLPILDLERV